MEKKVWVLYDGTRVWASSYDAWAYLRELKISMVKENVTCSDIINGGDYYEFKFQVRKGRTKTISIHERIIE